MNKNGFHHIQVLFERPGFWVFVFSFFLCSLVMGGHLYSPDEEVLFRTAESFSRFQGGAIEPLGGTARVRNAQGEFETVYQEGFATRQGSGEAEYAQYGIGQPLLAVPLVWAGKILAQFAPDSLLETLHIKGIQYHNRTVPEYTVRLVVSRFNQFITALTAWVIYWLTQKLYRNRQAGLGAALIYVTATIALPHSKTFFTEPLAGLCALASLALAFRGIERMRDDSEDPGNDWVLSGFVFGYGVLTRLDTIILAPGIALYLFFSLWQSNSFSLQQRIATLIRWALPAGGCILIILVLNTIRFGSPFSSGYSDQPEGIQFSTPLLLGLYGFLFSAGKSLFLFSPPLIFAPVGWWKMRRQHQPMAAAISISTLLFLVFHAKWQNWEGGWCWGPRHIFQITPLLALCLGWLFAEPDALKSLWQKSGLLLVVACGWFINALGVSVSFMDTYAQLPTEMHHLTLFDPLYTLPPPALLPDPSRTMGFPCSAPAEQSSLATSRHSHIVHCIHTDQYSIHSQTMVITLYIYS